MAVQKPEVVDPRFTAGCIVTLEQVEIKWSHLIIADTKYKAEWSIWAKLSPTAASAMKKIGYNVKEDSGDGSHWLKVKSVCQTRAGVDQSPPVVVDQNNDPITKEPGNGSICDIEMFSKYTDPIQNKIHMTAYIEKVTVTDYQHGTEEVKF